MFAKLLYTCMATSVHVIGVMTKSMSEGFVFLRVVDRKANIRPIIRTVHLLAMDSSKASLLSSP